MEKLKYVFVEIAFLNEAAMLDPILMRRLSF